VNQTCHTWIDPARSQERRAATGASVVIPVDEAIPHGATVNSRAAVSTTVTRSGSPVPARLSTTRLPDGAHNVVNSGDHRREPCRPLVHAGHSFGRHICSQRRARPLIVGRAGARSR